MINVESQGAVDVVRLDGALNHENADQLAQVIQSGLSGGQPMVVLDMSDVPLLDSAGLEALLDARDFVLRKGGDLKLASLSQLCQEVLRVTGVGSHFQCHPVAKSAVGSFVQ